MVRVGIDWCSESITTRCPRFKFHVADVQSAHYNPEGGVSSESYEFPFAAGAFDFVFLTSVFTHMLPVGVEHYLREIARVLGSGGRCLATFFLVNSPDGEVDAKIGPLDLKQRPGVWRSVSYLT